MAQPFQDAQSLLQQSQGLNLSARDFAQWLVSLLAAQQSEYQVWEATIAGQAGRHYVVAGLDQYFDCGRNNSYHSQLQMIANAAALNLMTAVAIPPLPLAQLAFLCMESAHFDHCY